MKIHSVRKFLYFPFPLRTSLFLCNSALKSTAVCKVKKFRIKFSFLGNWQHWYWQHFHIGNILKVPHKILIFAYPNQFTAESSDDLETTFLKQLLILRTGELARAFLLYCAQTIISTLKKNAGVLARAPNTNCFYQLFRLFPI